MSHSIVTPREINTMENHSDAHPRYRGLIVFCETKLRYEKGLKAWIFLGPYLLGALGLEMLIDAKHVNVPTEFWPWVGFVAYLVLFPSVWQRILKLVRSRKALPIAPTGSSAAQLP
ncbi:MAG: hypothetical protein LV481_05665 [Methylacidiphilales bacterium]|nr:hypothetical protein [Candidatus Methylacidiphilales bacterium]